MEARKNKSSKKTHKTDWTRLQELKDKDIDLSEIPEITEDQMLDAEVGILIDKVLVSIRLDREVLDWFRAQGQGYETRINDALREYIAEKR